MRKGRKENEEARRGQMAPSLWRGFPAVVARFPTAPLVLTARYPLSHPMGHMRMMRPMCIAASRGMIGVWRIYKHFIQAGLIEGVAQK